MSEILERLYEVVRQRQAAGGEDSYVATLTARGLPKVRSKVIEEAGEVIEASVELAHGGSGEALAGEAADLLFHLLVLLGAQEVPISEVLGVLEARFGTGGLEEKARRTHDP